VEKKISVVFWVIGDETDVGKQEKEERFLAAELEREMTVEWDRKVVVMGDG